jgi:protein TonB
MASAQALSRKTIVGIVVIGVHVLLAIGLVLATAAKYIPQLREVLDAKLVKHEEEEKPKEPPPPPPDFKPPPVQTPVVDLPIIAGPPPVTAIVQKKVEAPPPPPPKAPPSISPARVAKGVNLGELCEPYFPSASRRLNEEGSVVILFKVLANGHVGETKIETSSGYPRLDEATAKCLTSQGRFEPERVGSEVHESWQRLKYTWRLRT